MKIKHLLLVAVLSIILLGCSSEHSVVLYNADETIYKTYSEVKSNSVLELPILEEEGQIFVGWSDGDIIYNNDLRIRRDIELSAVFEDASEVFVYDVNPQTKEISIRSYNGEAKHLKIPVRIEGMTVKSIQSLAFGNSELIEIEVPKSLNTIYSHAFKGSNDLEKISFYGEYFGEVDTFIDAEEYDELLIEYADACTAIENNESSWTFSEGCPIKSVNDYEVMEFNGIEYINYEVTVDLRYYENMFGEFMIKNEAFYDMESLTTVEFPERYQIFHPGIFYNTPRLVNLTFENNEYYEIIDNVVYNANTNALIYYPAGLEYEHFDIPDFVTEIGSLAFGNNFYLKTISIHDAISKGGTNAFQNMHQLEAIHVDSDNIYYYSIDGVLYSHNHTLLAYPTAKTDTEFIMPETTTTVASNAFYGQKYLEFITLSPNLEYLGHRVFMEVEKLKVLDVPSSVIYIGSDLTRSSTVETIIINRSFIEDGSLPGPILYPYPDYPEYYVPDDSLSEYLSDFNWQFISEYINPISELDTEE
jgi:hypothetical protein